MTDAVWSEPGAVAPAVCDGAPPRARSVSVRAGSIVLARHGEPALSRKVKLDAEGYRRWWATYEAGGILAGQTPPDELVDLAREADVIFASSRPRAVETAQAVVAGRPYVSDALFVEAPLPPPPVPRFVRFSPKTWGVIARTAWWFLGYDGGQETRGQAEARAREAATRLTDHALKGSDVLLLAHGFFNTMVGLELRRRGWSCVSKERGFRYWATRRFERP